MTNTLNTNIISTVPGFNGTSGPYSFINDSTFTINNGPTSLEVKGPVVINGRNLEERLETIEKVLGIPERDEQLEKEYPKLKKMYEDYINELSKYRTWNELKK